MIVNYIFNQTVFLIEIFSLILVIIQTQMRQRYFSPDNLNQSQQYTFTHEVKQQKRLRSNGSVSTMITYPISNAFEENSDKIGNYTIDLKKQIGSGYSSKVYKGYSLKDSHQVAVKVLNIKKFSPSSLQMLEAQIKILQNLNHPNILKCFDVYKTSNQCYIVTQYCASGDLQTYMTRKGVFQQKEAIQIINQISQGIKHLLKNGIIHRDIKPANILQGKSHWKIADFGFAIQSSVQITTKHNVGTPLYMPLEALIKNLYSPQSDIFAVGIMLYEMLVGVTPWQCSSQKQLIKRLSSIPLKIPSKTKISLSTRHLLQKLCSLSIGQRMNKQQFLSLNFNNFSSLDILNTTYSKKAINGINSKKVIENKASKVDNKKSQTKSKSKRKTLIKVTSKDTLIKPKLSQNSSLLKSKVTIKQKSKGKNKRITSTKSKDQYLLIANQLASPSHKNRKRSIDSTIILKRKKSVIKQISTQPCIQHQSSETLSTSIYASQNPQRLLNPNQQSSCQSIQNKFQEKLLAINHRIMINQLDYCRFMYYFVKNMNHMSLSENSRQKLGLLIFKHLIRVIKLLADSKNNWFGFMNWQSFKKSKKYQHTLDTVTQYSQRYQKEYLSYIKYLQISVVREINQKISQLSSLEPFTINLLSKMLLILAPIIKEANQNLNMIIPNQLATLNKKTQSQVEGFASVVKYYRLIQLSINQFQNYTHFQENSEFYFLKDFNESVANAPVYFKIKDQIKFI